MAVRRAVSFLAIAALALGSVCQPKNPKYFFVFGDSYSSTGFKLNGTKPSAANPLGNPPLPGTTLTGGMTWVGYLTTQYNTSQVLTYNFAEWNSVVDNAIIAPYDPAAPSISDQVHTWTGALAAKPDYAPWTSDNALFGVFVGTNDIGQTFLEPETMKGKLEKALDRLFELLGKLHDAGAKKFLLIEVPPTYRAPLLRGISNTTTQDGIQFWNGQLGARTETFKQARPGAEVTLSDVSQAWNEPLDSPPVFGAKDADCVVCPGPGDADCGVVEEQTCLWYNVYHPGTTINKQTAKEVAASLKGWL